MVIMSRLGWTPRRSFGAVASLLHLCCRATCRCGPHGDETAVGDAAARHRHFVGEQPMGWVLTTKLSM